MIYFIQQGFTGPVKVGYSKTAVGARGRLRAMQTAHCVELRMLAVVPGGIEDERRLHRVLAEWRIRGEWFAPSEWLLSLAGSRRDVQLEVLRAECDDRWQKWGLLRRDGVLTERGAEYLFVLEREVAIEDSLDLERFATEWIKEFRDV